MFIILNIFEKIAFCNFIDCSKNNNKLKKKYDCDENQVLLKFFVNFINRGFADYNQENGNEMIINSLYLNNITCLFIILFYTYYFLKFIITCLFII